MDEQMRRIPLSRPIAAKWARRLASGMVVLLVGAGLVAAPANPAFADETRDKQWMVDALNVAKAWETAQGEGVTVGVVDSGVDKTHPDLKGSVKPGTSYTEDGADGRTDPDGHGTAIASLIAGHGHNDGADGVVGIAPKAKILPAQTRSSDSNDSDEDTSDADLANAIRWLADNGADIISLAFGHVSGNDVEHAAIKYAAIERGIPVVAGVGNVGEDYGTGDLDIIRNETLYPAGYNEVVGSSGTTADGKLADSSMYGKAVAVGAPGEDVIAAEPGKGYTNFGGTSSATAVTAGVLALLKSAYPDDTRMELIWRLTELTTEAGKDGLDDKFGYGIVNPAKALTEDPGTLPEDMKDPEPTGSYSEESSTTDDEAALKAEDSSSSALSIVLSAGIAVVALAALVGFVVVARRRKRARLATVGMPTPSVSSPGVPPPPPTDAGSWARPSVPPDDARRY